MIKVALALLGALLGAAVGVRASRAVWAVVTQPGLGEDPEGGDEPKLCGAKHGTNDSFVPCMRRAGHAGDHWSTSGCAGGQFAWSGESGDPYFRDGNPDQPKPGEKP